MSDVDFAELYLIGEAFRSGALRVDPVSEISLEESEALARGERSPASAVTFAIDEPGESLDFVGSTHSPALTLVSDRVVTALRAGNVSGWATYPVKIRGVDVERTRSYHGLAITGRAGPPDEARAESIIIPPPSPSGQAIRGRRGLYFPDDSWDGSDVFLLGATLYAVATERVRRLLDSISATNVQYDRLTEVERWWDDASLNA